MCQESEKSIEHMTSLWVDGLWTQNSEPLLAVCHLSKSEHYSRLEAGRENPDFSCEEQQYVMVHFPWSSHIHPTYDYGCVVF